VYSIVLPPVRPISSKLNGVIYLGKLNRVIYLSKFEQGYLSQKKETRQKQKNCTREPMKQQYTFAKQRKLTPVLLNAGRANSNRGC
jgi:hypothetical protein